MTVKELLDYLDGQGLVITDEDELVCALDRLFDIEGIRTDSPIATWDSEEETWKSYS